MFHFVCFSKFHSKMLFIQRVLRKVHRIMAKFVLCAKRNILHVCFTFVCFYDFIWMFYIQRIIHRNSSDQRHICSIWEEKCTTGRFHICMFFYKLIKNALYSENTLWYPTDFVQICHPYIIFWMPFYEQYGDADSWNTFTTCHICLSYKHIPM